MGVSVSAHAIRGIDHLIVAARELDRSAKIWEGLGFSITPRGFHQTGGTANHLLLFDETYIELLGVVDPTQPSPFARYLDLAPGLAGMAFRASADEAFTFWQAQGLLAVPPASLARDVEVRGRTEIARFRLTLLEDAPELPLLLFCCEQLTRELVWQEGKRAHPNGAKSLKELVFVVDELQAQARFERITGRPSTDRAGSSELALGEVRVSFLSKESLRARFGEGADFRNSAPPRLAGFALETADLERARGLAVESGFGVRDSEHGGFVTHVPDEGVFIEWMPASSNYR